jgi:serine/threonine protein kinase
MQPRRPIDEAFALARVARELDGEAEPIVVGERYELLRKIGSGGYGSVYEAHDRQLGRRVAVKVLAFWDSDVAMREGQALAELDHRHVVTIFDHGTGPDYRYFILQLLDGPDLLAWCTGKSPAEIIAKYLEAASGLAAAHAKGLIHRDFKPDNVRLGSEGQAVVVDFGLVRHVETRDHGDGDAPGRFAGTLSYAAPERLFGLPGDEQADVFSFCVALWWALSGENPFGPCPPSMTPEERMRATFARVVGSPRGPMRVERALRRGLSPRLETRWSSMEALIAAIAPKPRRAWAPRKLVVVGVAAVVAVGLLMPARGGGSLECVGNARARWSGAMAVAAAREGNVDGALWRLETAERVERSGEVSRTLGMTSEEVAVEFERRSFYSDAMLAWTLAIRFARHGGDIDLDRRAEQRLRAAARAATAVPPQNR